MVCVWALAWAPAAFADGTANDSQFRCRINDQIPAAERAEIESAALAFANKVVAGDLDGVYAALSDDGRPSFPKEYFTAILFPMITSMEPQLPRIGATYFVRTEGEPILGSASCNDPAHPETAALLDVVNTSFQARVVTRVPTFNNDFGLVLLLIRVDDVWRVHAVYLSSLAMAGKDGFNVLALGREQDRKGNTFNATLLYTAGAAMLDRGPGFELDGLAKIRSELAGFELDPSLAGDRPLAWTLEGQTYSVGSVDLVAIAGDIYLMVSLPLTTWAGDKAADEQNRQFLSAFMKKHPEWKSAFKGVYAKAISPAGQTAQGGPSFTTGYFEGEGFGDPPKD